MFVVTTEYVIRYASREGAAGEVNGVKLLAAMRAGCLVRVVVLVPVV
jgi:hypothetical protein